MVEQTFSKRTLELLKPDYVFNVDSFLVFKFKRIINEASIIITIKIAENQDEKSLHGNIHCKKGTVSFKYTEYFKSFDSFLYYLDYGKTSKKYNRGTL